MEVLSIDKLKLLNDGITLDLPVWIKFGFKIGSYIDMHKIESNKRLTIVISLPTEHYFPLFIAMGIANNKFMKNKHVESIRKQILDLKPGARIIYKDGENYKKVSVLSIKTNPIFKDQYNLFIKVGTTDTGVPERQWFDKFILIDEESDEIKQSRKVSNKKKLGIENNTLLSELYSSNQLKKISFYPGDYIYIVGNTSQLYEQMHEEIFIYNNVKGKIDDFLYLDDHNSYTNGRLFSYLMRKNDYEILEDIPVIFSNPISFIKQSKYFINNPKIIIYNRSDNKNRLLYLKEELKRRLFQYEHIIVTDELVDFMENSEVIIPNGIELLAWRQ